MPRHAAQTSSGCAISPARSWYMGKPGTRDMTTICRFWSFGVGTGKPWAWSARMKAYSRMAASRER